MNLEKILYTGNEVRIRNEKGSFITSIQKIIAEDTITILLPPVQKKKLNAQAGEMLVITCVTDRGLYMFEAKVNDSNNLENPMAIELKTASNIKKIQRREAFRARESIVVRARRTIQEDGKPGKWVSTKTVDISETGMLLKFNEELATGQLLELVIHIDKFGINETLQKVTGRVTRCTETRSKEFHFFLGIEFNNLPEKARDIILKLVVLSQRSKLTYKYAKRY